MHVRWYACAHGGADPFLALSLYPHHNPAPTLTQNPTQHTHPDPNPSAQPVTGCAARGTFRFFMSFVLSFTIGACISMVATAVIFPWCACRSVVDLNNIMSLQHIVADAICYVVLIAR